MEGADLGYYASLLTAFLGISSINIVSSHGQFCHQVSFVVHPMSSSSSSVVNFSHFNLLLRNHWANLDQTLVEWSLDGPLPKLCLVIPASNQDGRQAKNGKKGDEMLIVHWFFSTVKMRSYFNHSYMTRCSLTIFRVFVRNVSFSRFIPIMQIRHIMIKDHI